MIQERKFSEASKELEIIVEKAKSFGLIAILDRASEMKLLVDKKKEFKILAFISYALRDSETFKIKEIAKKLTDYKNIENVLYCEEHTRDNFIKYMNKYVGECDVMILFCSPNALKSKFVEDEWMAGHAMGKPIIPVFLKIDHIPPLLKARVGVEFDSFNIQNTINKLYEQMLKKTQT